MLEILYSKYFYQFAQNVSCVDIFQEVSEFYRNKIIYIYHFYLLCAVC